MSGMTHYTEMTREEYHAAHIVSEKMCGSCAYAKTEHFMGAQPAGPDPKDLRVQRWRQGPVRVQWCTLPASRNFGTLVAAFGTCDRFKKAEEENETVNGTEGRIEKSE